MTPQQIKDNKPDGATHYYISGKIATYIMYCGRTELSWINQISDWAMMDYPNDFDVEIKPL